jgi:ATP-binding cassette subfamily B multidrug efflux pump
MIRLLRFLKPYWKQAVLALVMMVFMTAADLAVPRLLQRIVDVGIAGKDMAQIVRTTAIMIGASLMGALMAIGNTLVSVRAAQNYATDLRSALYRKVQSLSFGNLDHLQTGRLMVLLMSDVTAVQQIVMLSMRVLIRAPLLLIGSMLLMVATSPRLGGMMLLVLLLTLSIVSAFAGRARPLFSKVQRKLDALNNVLQEYLAGVRVVKAFVRSAYEVERFGRANTELTDQTVQVLQFMSILIPTMTVFINLGSVAVVWFGGRQVIAGELTVGQILAFANYVSTIMFPVIFLGNLVALLSAAQASAQRILEVMDTAPEVGNRPQAQALAQVAGRVAFEEVCFSYNHDCSEPVLEHINLVAEAGQKVAILGATGSGKSSLIELISRFYDVTEGRLTIDGTDVRDVTLESLRSHIGIAMQETVLFRGTVRDNIAYGRPEASDEEVINAARSAQAHDFVLTLPDGYNTLVGERGATLSGGQKQRIAIARALLVQPRILILDDSTSSVDVETEARIRASLQELMVGRTTFIIAQRISSVLHADKIVVLDRGQIVAQGNHEELMASSEVYREIYGSQLGARGVLGD